MCACSVGSLLGGITVADGQGESLDQVPGSLLVQAQPGTGTSEEHVGVWAHSPNLLTPDDDRHRSPHSLRRLGRVAGVLSDTGCASIEVRMFGQDLDAHGAVITHATEDALRVPIGVLRPDATTWTDLVRIAVAVVLDLRVELRELHSRHRLSHHSSAVTDPAVGLLPIAATGFGQLLADLGPQHDPVERHAAVARWVHTFQRHAEAHLVRWSGSLPGGGIWVVRVVSRLPSWTQPSHSREPCASGS